jgi:hypothetical protein
MPQPSLCSVSSAPVSSGYDGALIARPVRYAPDDGAEADFVDLS